MLDLEGLPVPADAPAEGASWRLEHPEPGLAVLVLDPPHRPKLALLDLAVLRDLDLALERVERDEGVRGLVLTGREPLSFAGGADVEAIAGVRTPEDAARLVRAGQCVFERLAGLGREAGGRVATVAAVGGPVPGGACELALCCDRVLLADDDRSRIGLPEVRLGIIPAWGGSTRLPRRIGVPAALAAILAGRLFRAREAREAGVVDLVVPPGELLARAADVALGRQSPPRGRRRVLSLLVDRNPLACATVARQARKRVVRQTRGRYPAPLAAIDVVTRAVRRSLDESLAAEVEAVKPLALHPVTRNLIAIFRLSEGAKRLADLPEGGRAPAFERASVVGAGVMGAEIASLAAERGIDVLLTDVDPAQLERAERQHRAGVERRKQRGRLSSETAREALANLTTARSLEGAGPREIAIEAVAERLDVKRQVFAELAERLGPDAILATNTSSLSVGSIAASVPRPERVAGMHFFNPVWRMPLVEVVRAERTSAETIARTARLALDLGKTPIAVADVAGFLVNRLLGPYLDEAVRMMSEGTPPEVIDRALEDFGMPMGPCELLDEVGLDVAAHAAESLESAYGERMRATPHLAPLVARGDLGKKTGAGIYAWEQRERGRPRRKGPNPNLPPRQGARATPSEEAVDRCVLAMLAEAARALEEGVVATPGELDLALVLGTGFPPFRGGLLRHADELGAAEIVRRLERLAEDPGPRTRFEPPRLLRERGESEEPLRPATP